MTLEANVQTVRERLAAAKRALVVTGAGISAESGIPTFRGADGYWRKRRAEELASPEGFARDPKMVWEWYGHRRRELAKCKPNPGHFAVAEIERRVPKFLLITQNVDGLHIDAGSRELVEIHGSIWKVRPVDESGGEAEDRTLHDDAQLPLYDTQGRLLRPGVVWFGEMLPPAPLTRIDRFLNGGSIDICFVIGTSALFPYIVNFAYVAKEQGGLVVEVNPEPSLPAHAVDIIFADKSGEIMPQDDSVIGRHP